MGEGSIWRPTVLTQTNQHQDDFDAGSKDLWGRSKGKGSTVEKKNEVSEDWQKSEKKLKEWGAHSSKRRSLRRRES